MNSTETWLIAKAHKTNNQIKSKKKKTLLRNYITSSVCKYILDKMGEKPNPIIFFFSYKSLVMQKPLPIFQIFFSSVNTNKNSILLETHEKPGRWVHRLIVQIEKLKIPMSRSSWKIASKEEKEKKVKKIRE